jgi:hypothetical protein
MVRSFLAVVLGLVVALVVLTAAEWVGHFIYPLPEGIKVGDGEAMKQVIATMPTGAFLLLLAEYAVSSLAGGFFAAWIARRRPALHALTVGGVFTALGFANLLMLPGHPAWFWAANVVVYLGPAYLGSRLAPQGAPAQPAAA